MMRNLRSTLFAGGLCLLAAAASAQPGRTPVRPGIPVPEPYANACYHGIEPGRDACILDGRWQSEPGAGGAPTTLVLDRHRATGDLSGRGEIVTALVLTADRTGTGKTLYLVLAAPRGGRIHDLATIAVGPAAPVRSLSIQGGQVRLELAEPTPGDPKRIGVHRFVLLGDRLVVAGAKWATSCWPT